MPVIVIVVFVHIVLIISNTVDQQILSVIIAKRSDSGRLIRLPAGLERIVARYYLLNRLSQLIVAVDSIIEEVRPALLLAAVLACPGPPRTAAITYLRALILITISIRLHQSSSISLQN